MSEILAVVLGCAFGFVIVDTLTWAFFKRGYVAVVSELVVLVFGGCDVLENSRSDRS